MSQGASSGGKADPGPIGGMDRAPSGIKEFRSQLMDTKTFMEISRNVPLGKRPQKWWDLLSILGGIVGAIIWFFYASIRSSMEGFDLVTPILMVAIPIALVWFRSGIDKLLIPLQEVRRRVPKMILIGMGIAVPFLTAYILYNIFGLIEYPLMHWNLLVGTMLSYAIVREPQSLGDQRQGPSNKSRMMLLVLLYFGCIMYAMADDCTRDPLNANDCLRTGNYAQILAGIATAGLAVLVNGPEIARGLFGGAGSLLPGPPSPPSPPETKEGKDEGRQAEERAVDAGIIPSLDGGPDDNPFTSFDGGDGPGGCGPGLPNYWVNLATLNLVVQDVVFASQGLGPAIKIAQTYNSTAGSSGMFGRKWQLSYESMIKQAGETVYVWKGSGQRLSYMMNPSAGQSSNEPREAVSVEGKFDRLIDYGQYWLFIENKSHWIYRYEKLPGAYANLLTSISDLNGNSVHISYNADATIRAITDAAGRSISFAYNGNRLCNSFTTPDGRTATYAYDEHGNLVKAMDTAGVVTSYEYDADGYLSRIIVGRDRITTTFTYERLAQSRRIAAVTNANGETTRYEMVSVEPRQVRVTDPDGKFTSYFSREGLTEKIADPLGNAALTSYTKGLPVRFQDENGNVTQMEYDEAGNLIQIIDPLGTISDFGYDDNDNLISITNPLGQGWRYDYNRNNLTRVVSPMGIMLTIDYDLKGHPISFMDANGNKTAFAYDRFGNLVAITDPLGNSTRISYDLYGLIMTAITDARGNTTRYEYNKNNRLTRVTNPDGTSRAYTYGCCALNSIVDENGNRTVFLRDTMLLIKELTDPLGNVTRFISDRSNRLVRITNALGHSMNIVYDDAGRIIRWTNPLGEAIQLKYDPAGNLVSMVDEREKVNNIGYDAKNNPIKITDPLGKSVNFAWDALNRLSVATNARGEKVGFTFDAHGHITSKSYNGVQIATYGYDASGNIVEVTDPIGTTTYVYAANRVSSIRYPDRLECSLTYNEVGNLSSITYPGGFVVQYAYDDRNRVAKFSWEGNWISCRYDAAGNLIGESRSNGTESAYLYNANGEFIEIRHQRGTEAFARMAYTRDVVGNITFESSNLPLEPVFANSHVLTTYNDANQIMNNGMDHFTFDPDGNLAGISGGKFSAIYDPENRLVEITRDGVQKKYTYNGLGQRIKAESGSQIRNYHYDIFGRMLFETDHNGRIVAYYIYRGPTLAAQVAFSGEVHFYHFDKTGNTLALTDEKAEIAAAYAYGAFGSVVNKTGNLDTPFKYVGEFGVMDAGDGLYFMKMRYYLSSLGRFMQKDPIGFLGGINLYQYGGNNPISNIDPEGFEQNTGVNITKFGIGGLGFTATAGAGILLALNPVTWPMAVIGGASVVYGAYRSAKAMGEALAGQQYASWYGIMNDATNIIQGPLGISVVIGKATANYVLGKWENDARAEADAARAKASSPVAPSPSEQMGKVPKAPLPTWISGREVVEQELIAETKAVRLYLAGARFDKEDFEKYHLYLYSCKKPKMQ